MEAIRQNPVLGWFLAVVVGLMVVNVGVPLNAWISTPAGQDSVGRAVAWTIAHALIRGR